MTQKQIHSNKERFISILSEIETDGISSLIDFLCGSDFFTAPASAVNHLNEVGGLCQHSLNVYDNIMKLREQFWPDYPQDSAAIISLLHDISKVDFYKTEIRNKKVYKADGSKSDEMGRFDWESIRGYKVKDASERDYVCSEHGVNSYRIISRYISLTEGEACAIINHHAGMDNGFVMRDLNECFNRYPGLILLHTADMLATYVQENRYIVPDVETEDE